MQQNIVHISLLVKDYDEALEFYLNKLQFELIEDTKLDDQGKRWVVISPPNSSGATILLAKATRQEQQLLIGKQGGGRVMLFLSTDDVRCDYQQMSDAGVHFTQGPTELPHGIVAVFKDLYGNPWDLIQMSDRHSLKGRFAD